MKLFYMCKFNVLRVDSKNKDDFTYLDLCMHFGFGKNEEGKAKTKYVAICWNYLHVHAKGVS